MSKFQPLTLYFQDFDNFQVKKIFKWVKKSHSELSYGVICVYLYGIFLERNFLGLSNERVSAGYPEDRGSSELMLLNQILNRFGAF